MGRDEDTDDLRGFDSYQISLGDHLRGERATKGKSLLDVQRDLRIRASYIAAIENCDIGVFPNHGFVAGYVRSYARYLNLDPDPVFRQFCAESGFGRVNAEMQARKSTQTGRVISSGPAKLRENDPLMRSIRTPNADLAPSFLEKLPVSSVGSLLVLVALTGALGYGGMRVLQDVQRVTLTPVEQRPETFSEMAALSGPGLGMEEVSLTDDLPYRDERPTADADLARLYQPRELEVPVVEARDGPIVEIDPRRSGLYPEPAIYEPTQVQLTAVESATDPEEEVQVREEPPVPVVNIVARQPAWVRVSVGDGSILFEKILDPGETYTLPLDVEAPELRAGNSGAVYLLVNEQAYGPLGTSSSVAKNVSLLPDDIREGWPRVGEPPEVIQASVSALNLTVAAD